MTDFTVLRASMDAMSAAADAAKLAFENARKEYYNALISCGIPLVYDGFVPDYYDVDYTPPYVFVFSKDRTFLKDVAVIRYIEGERMFFDQKGEYLSTPEDVSLEGLKDYSFEVHARKLSNEEL